MKKLYILIIAILTFGSVNAQWQTVGLGNNYYNWINTITVDSNKIYLSAITGIYLSTNFGNNWTLVDTNFVEQDLSDFVIKGNNIFACSWHGIFTSTNNGTGWTSINTGLTDTNISTLVLNGNNLYAGTYNGKIFVSTNNGLNWIDMNTGFINTYVASILFKGNNIYVGTGKGVYLSTNNGINWSAVNVGLTDTNITKLTISGNNILAGANSGRVYLSTNNGSSWSVVLNPNLWGGWYTSAFATIGDTVYAAVEFKGVYRSTDNGNTWLYSNYGMQDSVNALAICGNYVFAGTWHGLSKHSFANFYNQDTITVTINPLVGGVITGTGIYTIYHPCTLKAFPNPGYTFTSWNINGFSGYIDSILTFDVVKTMNLIANFTPICSANYTLVQDTSILHHYFIINNASGVAPIHYHWSWGDGTIDTIAYPTHTYNNSGWYNVCLTIIDAVGCTTTYCDSSNLQKSTNSMTSVTVIPQGTLGINTNEIHKLEIYPNPTSSTLTIETNSNTKQNLEIVNLLGQTMYTFNIYSKATVDVSAFAKGIYLIKLNTDKGIVVKRFVKE